MEQPSSNAPVPDASKPPAPPWSVRETWYGVGLLVVAVLAAAFGIYALRDSPVLRGFALTISELPYLLPVVIILARKTAGWRALAFRAFDGRLMGFGCGLLALVYVISFCQNAILLGLKVQTQGQSLLGFLDSGQTELDLILSAVIAAPFIEETFFRGFLFQGLRQGYGWKKAAVISSLLFAIMHFQLAALLPTFLMGLVFAVLYNRANSIWPGIILHFTLNAFGICMLIFTYRWSSLPAFTP